MMMLWGNALFVRIPGIDEFQALMWEYEIKAQQIKIPVDNDTSVTVIVKTTDTGV